MGSDNRQGAAGDIVNDGAEVLIIPVLVATALMPYLAPSAIVQQLRAERAANVPQGRPSA
jgi:hypothetical protein